MQAPKTLRHRGGGVIGGCFEAGGCLVEGMRFEQDKGVATEEEPEVEGKEVEE